MRRDRRRGVTNRRRGVTIGIGAIVFLATALTVSNVASSAQAQGVGGMILQRLEAAADAGDPRAQAALADLHGFLVTNHLDQSVLDHPSAYLEDARHGEVRTVARGLVPFWIDVAASADLSNAAALARYIAERRVVASGLVAAGSAIEGRLAFAGLVPLDRLLSLRDQLGLEVRAVDIDVWLDNKWVSRAGFGPEATEFWAQPAAVADKALRSLIADAHAGEPVASRISEAQLTVHGATLDVSAQAAGRLLEAPDVLLFDPYTDLLDAYRGLAVHVRLVAPVDVFDSWLRSRASQGDPYLLASHLDDSK